MAADTRKRKRNQPSRAAVMWVASAAALLIASLLMLVGTFFVGGTAEDPFKTYRRVEFDLSYDSAGNAQLSNLLGETLDRETAMAMADLAQKENPTEPAPSEEKTEEPAEEAPAHETPHEEPVHEDPAHEDPTHEEPTHQEPADIEPTPLEEAPVPAEPIAEEPAQTEAPTPAEQAPAPVAQQPEAPSIPLAPVEQQTAQGILPVIAADGTKPWNYFAQKAPATGSKPRIAVVVSRLGLVSGLTQDAIALPPAVSLSFSPYGRETAVALAQSASAAGHELLLDLPMQTVRFPADDPGPYGIRTDLTTAENIARLTAVLSKARGYVGLMGTSRDVVADDAGKIIPLIQEMERRGLLFVLGHSQIPAGMFRIQRKSTVPVLLTDIVLDDRITETHIRNQLARAEDRARTAGSAVVLGRSYPLTVDLLAEWLNTLESKGFAVVPISALGQGK